MGRWNLKSLAVLLCPLWLALQTTPALSFTVNESTDGDLSGIDPVPTPLVLDIGANTIVGSAGSSGLNQDYDIFRFSVLPNSVLTSITVASYEPGSGMSFFAMQEGIQWTAGKGNGISVDALAGWTLFGANDIGSDLLPTMSTAGSGASGFNVPLTSGDYVFLIQDTGTAINYGLSFTASPVPIPASLPLLGLAFLSLVRRNSRARRGA